MPSPTPPVKVDTRNVQTAVLHYVPARQARHLLYAFGKGTDPAAGAEAARAFLAALAPTVEMGPMVPPEEDGYHPNDTKARVVTALGLTAAGLGALGVAPSVMGALDAFFLAGPSPLLGDVKGSPSDEANWWGGNFKTGDVHLTVHLNSSVGTLLDAKTAEIDALAAAHGARQLYPEPDDRPFACESMGDGLLHFGYVDGFSMPNVDWDDANRSPGGLDLRNFVLGYSNDEFASAPAPIPSQQAAADLLRDSSYGAFRCLYQDVAGFNRFLAENGPRLFPSLDPVDAEEKLAAKLMGRWRDGTPLVESPNAPMGKNFTNGFRYQAPGANGYSDAQGFRCPFSAHIRVVNPRDDPLVSVAATEGVPRVLRRGMPYGPAMADPRSTVDDGIDRGLVGIFLCTDLRRQFAILCNWIKRNDFSSVYGNPKVQDGLMANRRQYQADASFTIPDPQGDKTIPALPDFIRTKGTLYLLYPSRSTLERLSRPPAAKDAPRTT